MRAWKAGWRELKPPCARSAPYARQVLYSERGDGALSRDRLPQDQSTRAKPLRGPSSLSVCAPARASPVMLTPNQVLGGFGNGPTPHRHRAFLHLFMFGCNGYNAPEWKRPSSFWPARSSWSWPSVFSTPPLEGRRALLSRVLDRQLFRACALQPPGFLQIPC
jgi:hypothetical protein